MAREFHHCKGCGAETAIWASNRKEAQRKLEWWARTHPLCRECETRREFEKAAARAADLELPTLTGTPKQIEWAERIRVALVNDLMLKTAPADATRSMLGKGRDQVILNHICGIIDANEWIDLHRVPLDKFVVTIAAQLAEAAKPENDPALIDAVNFEATIRPETPASETVATFKLAPDGQSICIAFPELNDKFRESIKLFGATWDWGLKHWEITTSPEQQASIAAEVGQHLLGCGFVVRVRDNAVREMITSGAVAQSDGRRIDYAGNDLLRVDWRRIDGDYYDAVKAIGGSRWSSPHQTVLVPVTAADEIRDFAATYGFQISDVASRAFEAFDQYRRNGMIVAGKKREAGKAEPILDPSQFPATIKIADSLLDA